MLVEERRKKIINALQREEKVNIKELAKKFDVSEMIIRRDLSYLEDKGLAVKTHGGAVVPDILDWEVPYQSKKMVYAPEKKRIGQKAIEFIKSGQSIILDAGTTCLTVAQNLKDIEDLTVVTNDLKIALELYNYSNIEVICAGGRIQSKVGAMIGNYTEKLIEAINVDLAFLGTSAVDNNYILTTPTADKAFLKRKMINSATESILLTDHSKYGKKSLNKICQLEDIETLITDDGLAEKKVKELEKLEIELLLV